jgi:O-acetyl-ADP-ribose deacetylase (regulator of RNase III)
MIRETQGNITQIRADVIINAVNTELIHGGGVLQKQKIGIK